MGWIFRTDAEAQEENEQINAVLRGSLSFRSDSFLSDFIEASPNQIYLKDVQTGRYLLTNNLLANWCGVESANHLIGLAIREFWIEDIYCRRKKLHLNPAVIRCEEYETERAEQIDAQMVLNKSPASIYRAVLKFNGFVEFEKLTKFPILDHHHKKVIALVALSQDLTAQCDLSELLQLYRQHYPIQQAIELLLKHLKIDSYFIKLPTVKEMQVLLALHGQSNRKKTARLFNISSNTLASHLQHLKEKLIVPDINELLAKLRKAHINSEISAASCE